MRMKAIVVVSMLLTVVAASSSLASRRPTRKENRAILRAAPANPYPAGYAHRFVRISTVDSRWAAVHIVASRGHHNQVQPDVASMYHLKRGAWVVHQEGNGGGCRMPSAVSRDLRLACY
jgi:hypothetical protein